MLAVTDQDSITVDPVARHRLDAPHFHYLELPFRRVEFVLDLYGGSNIWTRSQNPTDRINPLKSCQNETI